MTQVFKLRMYEVKVVFVLAENDFRKSFYMKPCVWLRMENKVFRKIIYFDCKIALWPRKYFQFLFYLQIISGDAQREKRKRKASQMCKQREFEIAPSSLRSCQSDRHPRPLQVMWDRTTNPRTDCHHHPCPPPCDGEIAPRIHEPIDPSLILTNKPTNRSHHDWSCDFDFFFFLFWFLFLAYIFWFSIIIFVWILRKCEKHDKNGFSRAFSAAQPNTRKYFPKYFLE